MELLLLQVLLLLLLGAPGHERRCSSGSFTYELH
jgi:hypothetical protein